MLVDRVDQALAGEGIGFRRPPRPECLKIDERGQAVDQGGPPVGIVALPQARENRFGTVQQEEGDRGMGPLIQASPDLVTRVDVSGDNPDVDTPDDLVRLQRSAGEGPP